MSAVEALRLARESGVRLGVAGADLILDADREPAPEVLKALRRHKAGIVALLTAVEGDCTAEDWRTFFDERAGTAEFDSGQTRAEAEAIAFEWCILEWLNRHPQHSDPGRCAWCGRLDRDGHVLSGRRAMATPGCIPSAGTIGAKTGGKGGNGLSRQSGWTPIRNAPKAPISRMKSGKTGAHDGWPRIGTAERFRTEHGGILPLDRRKSAVPGELPSSGMVGQPQVIADTDHRTCGCRQLIEQNGEGHPHG